MADDLAQLNEQMEAIEKEINDKRKELEQLRRKAAATEIGDYTFTSREGKPVALSSLFGDKDDLIIVHNMGTGCKYCTLWADGFNGEYFHLEDRAGFAVVSPNPAAVMHEFASGRNWRFTILSADGTSFFKDMGFESDKGDPWPGVSTFHRDKTGKVRRVSKAYFGPGDDFCGVWHFLDMLEQGPNNWQPEYVYNKS